MRFLVSAGSSFGLSVGSLVFGYIGEYTHWKYIFHITSLCGVIWSVLWYNLVYDSPQQHPRISLKEKEYIDNSLKKVMSHHTINVSLWHSFDVPSL